MKNILIIGAGGREHALAWAIARSPQVQQVYVTPGNAGIAWSALLPGAGLPPRAAATSISIASDDFSSLKDFARQNQIDLTIVGPEAPLAAGIVDTFREDELPIFGPNRAAAQLESSKAFAKAFMRDHAIPTADYVTFTDYDTAKHFITAKPPNTSLVVKADGLAAGKGVIVCANTSEALEALHRIMIDREFASAGNTVIVEERLVGREVSVLAFTDGKTLVCMPPARDHKPVFDGDQGPNTGGMGAYTHPPDVDEALLTRIEQTVLHPTIAGMVNNGIPYTGVLYAGIMLTTDGPKVLEFNCRFGDPEIEAILPLLETDLFEVLMACTTGQLDQIAVTCKPGVGATVVLASPGYPGSYPKGLPITGLDELEGQEDVIVFHAGTAKQEGRIVTAGGRVLAVSAIGPTLPAAIQRAYDGVAQIHFEGMHYRRDIGR
jgi:phosphoribosylamine--glycine ligase